MIPKDWSREAAREVARVTSRDQVYEEDPQRVAYFQSIIEAHCPLKRDVAYMPVPRCDGCRHWSQYKSPYFEDQGACQLGRAEQGKLWADEGAVNTFADFGCAQWEAKPAK